MEMNQESQEELNLIQKEKKKQKIRLILLGIFLLLLVISILVVVITWDQKRLSEDLKDISSQQPNVSDSITQENNNVEKEEANNDKSENPEKEENDNRYFNQEIGYSFLWTTEGIIQITECPSGYIVKKGTVVISEKSNVPNVDDPYYVCSTSGEYDFLRIESNQTKSQCISTDSWSSQSSEVYVDEVISEKCVETFIGEYLYSGSENRITISIPVEDVFLIVQLDDPDYEYVLDEIINSLEID